MNKTFLLLLLSCFMGFSASAQLQLKDFEFWKKQPEPVRLPLIKLTATNSPPLVNLYLLRLTDINTTVNFPRTRYSCDLEEASIMKDLYHTLRFRMYSDAINSMNRLVDVYINESRYSEAKWYLLQCNYFGKKISDNHVVIASLISLGMLKADIGEYDQAKEDLLQAQDICLDLGMAIQAGDIEKKLKTVETKRFANVKNDLRYAEVVEDKKG